MKITDLKKDDSKLIYKQILNVNKVNENYTLLREVIIKNETQYKDIKLKNYRD